MSDVRYRLIALHGFLGKPSDWDGLAPWFPDADLKALDLWQIVDAVDAPDWTTVPAALAAAIRRVSDPSDGMASFVLAYSFGARLALAASALSVQPPRLRGYSLVSCHPGLLSEDLAARQARLASDEAWARRILEASERDLWAAWDAQAVFGGPPPRPRGALPAPRASLARALRACSLALQPDFRPHLSGAHPPLLWVTGARDARFSALAADVAARAGGIEFAQCEQAGHRVPWDNAPAFSRLVRHWIERRLDTP